MTLLPKVAKRGRIDKSALALGEPARIRDAGYWAFVAADGCAVKNCHGTPVQVHHLMCGPEPKARGLKSSDCWTLGLCVRHHAELHAAGDERKFWAGYGIEPVAAAAALWAESQAARRD